MNSTFSFSRWLSFINLHLAENGKKYLLGILAMGGVLVGWYIFLMAIANRMQPIFEGLQFGSYLGGLFIGGCLFASLLFSDLSNRPRGINFLLLPASHLEKLLAMLLFGVVLFFIFYTAVFYVVNYGMVGLQDYLIRENLPGEYRGRQTIYNLFSDRNLPQDLVTAKRVMLSLFFAIQSAFILGSVYFKRYAFIKTVISLLVVTVIFALYIGKVLVPTMPPNAHYSSFTSLRIMEDGNIMKMVALPHWTHTMVEWLLKYAFAPILYTITYFRLREKEI